MDQQKGKFRSFLLGSLQKFLSNEALRARCIKRVKPLQFYDGTDGRGFLTQQARVGRFEQNLEPEKRPFKVCEDVVSPSRGRIESLVFLFFGAITSTASVHCFSELFRISGSGYLEQTFQVLLRR